MSPGPAPVRVLLSGYYGYGNLGDEALLAGLSSGLAARGARVCVLSGAPKATRALHGVVSADRYRGLPAALLRAGAVVSGGGGLLQDVSSRRSLSYYLTVLRLARLLGKRACVYGQSIGPLSDGGRRRVARALQGVPVAVRDAPSQALLRDLGVPATLVADPALLLPCPEAGSQPPLPADAKPVLLVPRAGHADLNAALTESGRRLAAGGTPVAVLGLHLPADEAAVADTAEALGVAPLRARTPADAMRLVGGARFVVSIRLHGLIFAAACGVGFAGLVYDPKVAAFLAEARAPAFRRPVDPARVAAVAAEAVPPDAEAVALLRRRARDGLDWLERQLGAAGPVQEHTGG